MHVKYITSLFIIYYPPFNRLIFLILTLSHMTSTSVIYIVTSFNNLYIIVIRAL
jgi:hypothetical protein